jgi:hypothetical protein
VQRGCSRPSGPHALRLGAPGRTDSAPGGGRLAQRESASFTPRRSLVRSQYRPPTSDGRVSPRDRPFLLSVQQRSTATLCIELAAQAPERLAGRGRGNLAVDLHRHADLRMPEDLHGHPGMNAQGHQERAAGTPGVVDLDVADASLRAAEREVPGKVPRLARSSQGRGEYEVAVLPGVSPPGRGRPPGARREAGARRRICPGPAGRRTSRASSSLGDTARPGHVAAASGCEPLPSRSSRRAR